jgi:hypothetical protein
MYRTDGSIRYFTRSTAKYAAKDVIAAYGGPQIEKADRDAGIWGHLHTQLDGVCADQLNEPAVADGLNAAGF